MRARVVQILVCYYRGDLAGVERQFAADLNSFEQSDVLSVVAVAPASFSACLLGRAEIARQRQAQMRRVANDKNQWEMGFVEMNAAIFHGLLKEYEHAERLAARALELSETSQFPVLAASSRVYLGHARAQLGQTSDGIALIRRGIADRLEIGTHPGLAGFFTCLAAAQERAGLIDDALESVERSLQVNPDVLIARPEALRLRGELRLKKGQAEAAEADLRDAIALARSIGAKMLELEATTSLAYMLTTQCRRDVVRAMLAEIYGWFTEASTPPMSRTLRRCSTN